MFLWNGAQGRVNVAKKRKNSPTCDVASRELQIQKANFFQNLQSKTCWIRWGIEQFSSSIGWRVMALQTFQKMQKSGARGTWKYCWF